MLQGEVFHLVHSGSLCNFCLVFVKLLSLSSGRLDEICSLPLILVILNDSLLIVSPRQNQKCSKFVQSQFGYWGIRQQRETTGKPVLLSATPPPVSSTACSTGKPGSSLISSFSGHTKKKKQDNKLQFDLQDLPVAGKQFLDCTSVCFRLPERGARGLSNSFQ